MNGLTDFERFTNAYIECALWSSTADDGTPLDRDYDESDIAEETHARMQADCAKFVEENAATLDAADPQARARIRCDTYEQAGRDFWFTRNGHGAGFWDGDWPEPYAKVLTDAAHAFGECDLYVGDDGRIYA